MELERRWGRQIMWTGLGLCIAIAIGGTLAGGGWGWDIAAAFAFTISFVGILMRDRVRRYVPPRPDRAR